MNPVLKVSAIILIFILGVQAVYAGSATLFFGVPQKSFVEGERITVSVRVQSSSQAINAISGSVSFPDSLVSVAGISKERSIINLWTQEPKVVRNKIVFEGVALNPGFQGSSGLVFNITFKAKRTGTAVLNFNEGALLANDGLGTNVLAKLGSANFTILRGPVYSPLADIPSADTPGKKLAALPVIIEYSASVDSKGQAFLKGKGEPNALTKIVFKDVSLKSVGEQFIEFLQTNKKKLDEVLVQNDSSGGFQYTSANNVVAGVYNATPFLVDKDNNTEKPGFGVQFLISDSKVVRFLVTAINVLGLLIPIVGLIVIIYFIPWYSWRRMRVLKKKLGLEEEKIEISGHQLERQEKIADSTISRAVSPVATPPPTSSTNPQ